VEGTAFVGLGGFDGCGWLWGKGGSEENYGFYI
jgi:hypothetical protein